jgi:hypothetical protein
LAINGLSGDAIPESCPERRQTAQVHASSAGGEGSAQHDIVNFFACQAGTVDRSTYGVSSERGRLDIVEHTAESTSDRCSGC